MEDKQKWITKHKWVMILTVIFIFAMPLLIIHLLFLWNSEIDWLIARWSPGDLMAYVAGFEAFLGTVALGALALWQNQQIHKQHIESLEPILSMKLVPINSILYLVIQNTGQCEAKNIKICVENMKNNGNNVLWLSALFDNEFELYPNEIVQGRVAVSEASAEREIFPQLSVKVSYVRPDLNRKNEYKRTIIFDGGYAEKLIADVNVDNRRVSSDFDCIARATLRIANYLDGCTVRRIDEKDVLSKHSLQSDLKSIFAEAKKF